MLRPPCKLLMLMLLALLAACAPAAPAATGALPAVVADGVALRAGGRAFEMRGVNYIHPSNAEPRCQSLYFGGNAECPWQLAPVEADLDQLQRRGVNTIRVFLNYYVFGGASAADASYSIEYALVNFEQLLQAANQRGIYVMPVLLAKYPQDRFRAEDIAPAFALHVDPVVARFAGRSGIIAWDLFNEIDLGGPVDERCWDWDNGAYAGCLPLAEQRLAFIRALYGQVKQLDPARLVTASVGFAKSYFRPEQAAIRLADVVDLYSLHYYDDEPRNSGRYAAHWYYGQGFPADLQRAVEELHALGLEKPVLVTELGFPTGEGARRSEADLQRDLRAAREELRGLRVAGLLLWPFQPEYKRIPGDLFVE
ncbi:MAG: cellulase family glycosylhydrolase [Roseiflexaceae bacterium]|nr:cellulase family glycosylhydrolase [Roseiflexaceae bacterium]